MAKLTQQLTSVKVDIEIFEAFKIECVKTKFSLQKLADRCMYRYLTDPQFQKDVHNLMDLNKEELK
jgi:hypothetical protein